MKIVSCIVAAVMMSLVAGCETESSSQISISISPNHATLKKGESREFTASGWSDYTWSLSDSKIGVLSNHKGDTTTYTAVVSPSGTNDNATQMQVLTLSVNVPAETTATGTNQIATTRLVSAEALITHRYTP